MNPLSFSVRRRTSRAGERGMSLIEVLIAMLLASFVMVSVGYAYLSQRGLDRHRGSLAEIQDSARVALEAIGRDIRQAGYVGCNSNLARGEQQTGPDMTVLPPYDPALPVAGDNFTITSANALRVFDATDGVASWGGTKPANVLNSSHVIEVRYGMAEGSSTLSGALPNDGVHIDTRGQLDLGRGDDAPSSNNRFAMLSDCASGMIVVVDNVAGGNRAITATNPISAARCSHPSRVQGTCFYWPSTVLMPIRVVQYFVANTATAAAPRWALFARKRIMQPGPIVWNEPVLLIDNVATFRVASMGLDTVNPIDTIWGAAREVGEPGDPNGVVTLAPADVARVVRLDLRIGLRAGEATGADAKPVVRNFESSFSVRARTTSEVL